MLARPFCFGAHRLLSRTAVGEAEDRPVEVTAAAVAASAEDAERAAQHLDALGCEVTRRVCAGIPVTSTVPAYILRIFGPLLIEVRHRQSTDRPASRRDLQSEVQPHQSKAAARIAAT